MIEPPHNPNTRNLLPSQPPLLLNVTPNSGLAAGGNTVRLTGQRLSGVTAVRFGATPALSFTVVSDTDITARVPPGSGNVLVTVSSPVGTSEGLQYSYVSAPAPPVLLALVPNSGPAAGGNQVTVTGSGLSGVTSVRFGLVVAPSFTIHSDTSLTVAVPPGAVGSVQVTVSSPQGVSNGLPYLYAPAPVLLSVNPNQGPAAGGNTVSLAGSGFTLVTTVSFGGVPVPFTVLSDTSIAAQAPPGPAGPVAVTVEGPGGTSAPVTYTRLASPEI